MAISQMDEGLVEYKQRIVPRRKEGLIKHIKDRAIGYTTTFIITAISTLAIANGGNEPRSALTGLETQVGYDTPHLGSGIELRSKKPEGYIKECAEAVEQHRTNFEGAVDSKVDAFDPTNDDILIRIKKERDVELTKAKCELGCETWAYQPNELGQKCDYKAVFRLIKTCGPKKRR